MTPDEFAGLDGVGLAELVRRGEVSSRELVDAALARIDAHDGKVNSVVLRMDEEARRVAAGELPAGPFQGVPLLLKDIEAHYAGFPTSAGLRALARLPRPHDSEITRRFKRAGFVVIGKTNLPELAIAGVTESAFFGATRNPWNSGRTAGGSSGGAAAAVAARLVPIAHATDGGGSIRIPASMNGLFGLKPTRGRTPFGPDLSEVWCGFSVGHVLTRSVRDSAAVLDALAGPELGAPYYPPPPARSFASELLQPPRRLRIAVSDVPLFGRQTHPACSAALNRSAELCRSLGHEVDFATPSFDRDRMVRGYFVVVSAAVAADLRDVGRLLGRPLAGSELEDATWALARIGENLSAGALLESVRVYQSEARKIATFFEDWDVFITPTLAQPVPRLGQFTMRGYEGAALRLLKRVSHKRLLDAVLEHTVKSNAMIQAFSNTMLWNMTGQPAANVPLYWDDQGLPVGTQLIGRYADESTLLALAAQLEALQPWSHRRPPNF